MSSLCNDSQRPDYDVAIVGAGPVGMLLACLLAERQFKVIVVEKRLAPPAQSQAIGITPPSLEILAHLGLDREFVARGLPIRDCHVHGEFGYLGCASFRGLAGRYSFILSLPQRDNIVLLQTKLAEFPTATLHRGFELTDVDQNEQGVRLRGVSASGPQQLSASWLIGCDGHHSRVRSLLEVPVQKGSYGCHFLMGDFTDRSTFGADAHLFFTAEGAVESFPLPQGLRRWIVQTETKMKDAPIGVISQLVRQRTGFDLRSDEQRNQSAFSPRWIDCASYYRGRAILCGDAAHVMSPIGGQGMNTGWADAELIAEVITAVERRSADAAVLLTAYDAYRHRAVHVATRRAALGTWIGTRTGRWTSAWRDALISQALLQGPIAAHVGPHFAMQTIPYNNLTKVPSEFWNRASRAMSAATA